MYGNTWKVETIFHILILALEPNSGKQITEALRLQLHVQRCLHEQLEVMVVFNITCDNHWWCYLHILTPHVSSSNSGSKRNAIKDWRAKEEAKNNVRPTTNNNQDSYIILILNVKCVFSMAIQYPLKVLILVKDIVRRGGLVTKRQYRK